MSSDYYGNHTVNGVMEQCSYDPHPPGGHGVKCYNALLLLLVAVVLLLLIIIIIIIGLVFIIQRNVLDFLMQLFALLSIS